LTRNGHSRMSQLSRSPSKLVGTPNSAIYAASIAILVVLCPLIPQLIFPPTYSLLQTMVQIEFRPPAYLVKQTADISNQQVGLVCRGWHDAQLNQVLTIQFSSNFMDDILQGNWTP
jgi:hypothetical protein